MSDVETFAWDSSVLPVPDTVLAELRAQWATLAEAGTWWTGTERVALAGAARAASTGSPWSESPDLDEVAVEAASLVAGSAYTLTAEHVDDFEARGLDRLAYVELIGVVVRVVAIDTAVRGLGAPQEPLPLAATGAPSAATVEDAKRRSAWVPMAGGASPPTALTAVAAEAAAQERLHGALYLSYGEMADLDIHKGLHRTQLELVAARTSLLNECFF